MKNKPDYYQDLEKDITNAYAGQTTIEDAEKLAAKFLLAQMHVAQELSAADLDARMKKSGLKAVKAAVYMDAATKGEKKPTEAMLAATVDSDKIVGGEQDAYDTAEVGKDLLQNYYNIFREAHIYFRGIAKGKFE